MIKLKDLKILKKDYKTYLSCVKDEDIYPLTFDEFLSLDEEKHGN